VLQRKLGADGLARFFRLSRSGGDDYTRDREQGLNSLSLNDVLHPTSANRNRDRPTDGALWSESKAALLESRRGSSDFCQTDMVAQNIGEISNRYRNRL
jgi:hypothetical protein